MMKERTLYWVLLILTVFALAGERPMLKDDLARASANVARVLEVDEVIDGCESVIKGVGRAFKRIRS